MPLDNILECRYNFLYNKIKKKNGIKRSSTQKYSFSERNEKGWSVLGMIWGSSLLQWKLQTAVRKIVVCSDVTPALKG